MIKAGLTRATASRLSRRRAFTLVELLVVITIIAILAGILTVAVAGAMHFAQSFTVGAEIRQMEVALTSYYNQYGSYPPCMGTVYPAAQIVDRHLDTAFRNHREANTVFFSSATASGTVPLVNTADATRLNAAANWPEVANATMANLDASEALPFFLGGAAQYSQTKGCENLLGLKVDPVNPLTGSSTGSPVDLYDFKPESLIDLDGDGFPSWIPDQGEGSTPFVYFTKPVFQEPNSSGDYLPPMQYYCWPPDPTVTPADTDAVGNYVAWMQGTPPVIENGVEGGYDPGVVRPYIDGRAMKWYGKDTYQLLSAGLDGRYGSDGELDGAADPDYERDLGTGGDGWEFPAQYKFLSEAGTTATTAAVFPIGTPTAWVNMDPEDEDNVSNFTEGGTFGSIGLE